MKTLYDAACDVSNQAECLMLVVDAFHVLDDLLEEEGYQQEKYFSEEKAIQFSHRFPMMLSAMRLAVREVERVAGKLKELSDTYAGQENPET